MNKNSKALFNSHLTLDGFNEARSLTIMQGDKTDLEFILKDKNSEPIELGQISGQAQIVDSEKDTLVAVFNVDVAGSKATFSIDKALPPSEYEIYIKIGDFYFPSREDSFVIRVIESYDVVSDIDIENVQTIDIVVDALRADIIEAIKPEVGSYVDQILADDPDRFKGEKGDKFTVNDFTEEEWASLKGEDGNSLTFDQLDSDQQEALRGHSAYKLAVDAGFKGTEEEWLESLKGDKGDKGDTGDSAYEEAIKNGFEGSEAEWLESLNGLDGTVAYSDLDESQKAALRVPPKVYTRDEYNQLAVKDPNTLYFIEEV